jgi:hypothetical protein
VDTLGERLGQGKRGRYQAWGRRWRPAAAALAAGGRGAPQLGRVGLRRPAARPPGRSEWAPPAQAATHAGAGQQGSAAGRLPPHPPHTHTHTHLQAQHVQGGRRAVVGVVPWGGDLRQDVLRQGGRAAAWRSAEVGSVEQRQQGGSAAHGSRQVQGGPRAKSSSGRSLQRWRAAGVPAAALVAGAGAKLLSSRCCACLPGGRRALRAPAGRGS